MKAIQIDRTGNADVLNFREVPAPIAGAGDD